jgi:D-alanine-D-alanine ligase
MSRVGLIFGGRSVEHEVSLVSARTVRRGLVEAGHEVVCLGIAQDGVWVDPAASAAALDDASRRALEPVGGAIGPTLRHLLDAGLDAVFPINHGTWGEDGTLQGLMEMADIAYVGAGVTASAVAMDKRIAKQLFAEAGVPVVPSLSLRRGERQGFDVEAAIAKLGTPCFVKPSVGGSSVGVRKAKSAAELAEAIDFSLRFADVVLIERGIAAREVECAVLGYPDLEASVVGEIVPGREFYDYEDKYLTDGAQLLAPAPIDEATAARVRELAVRAFAAIEGSGMARVDFFLDKNDGALYVNEINSLPGFTSISMYPRLWGLSGVPLPQLVDRLVRDAIRRRDDRRGLDQGIKAFLKTLSER